MWKSIKEQVKIEVCDMSVYLALEAGLCALGMVIMTCVHMFGNEESYFPLGSMIAAIAVLCLIIFGNIFSLCMGFDMAVSMGKTRKQYYPSAIIVYFLMTLVLLAGLFLLLRVVTAIYGVLLPGKIKENIPIMTKFTVPWIFGGAAALNGCAALGAAIVRRFKRGRVIILAFWLLGCWTLPGATDSRASNFMNRIGIVWGQWFGGFETWAQISMMVGAGVALCAAAYLIFRKQAVQW